MSGSLASRLKVENPIKKKNSNKVFLIDCLKILVDGIAKTFGSCCEVVLHDLSNLDRSIVKIANGHVTGRTLSGSITDEGLKYLKSGRQEDLLVNYPSVSQDGRLLKSSTIIFRNKNEKPIAAICINFDVTDILNFNMAIQDIFKISEEIKKDKALETFEGDIGSTLNNIADKTISRIVKKNQLIERKDKIEIVRQLEGRGFFLIKGAIKLISRKLRISKFTIYNYLEKIRSENYNSNL